MIITIIFLILIALLGGFIGIANMALSKALVKKRITTVKKTKLLDSKYSMVGWFIISALAFILIATLANGSYIKIIEYAIVFTACLSLSVVDIITRKIPNELLIVLIIAKIIFLIIYKLEPTLAKNIATVGIHNSISQSLLGLVVAIFVFTLPAKLNKYIGMGDIKFAAIVGFYLGLMGFFQAIIIMATGNLVYWIYLKITGKGNLQTLAQMGPFISLGFIATVIYTVVK